MTVKNDIYAMYMSAKALKSEVHNPFVAIIVNCHK